MNLPKKLLIIVPILSLFVFAVTVYGAAPDGAGPWADNVVSTGQGLMKNGAAVPATRSDPNSALGVAENNTVEGNFYSLGFGGNIVLGFDNGISSGAMVIEATNPGYPGEHANVEMSENGTTWVMAGSIVTDGTVEIPDQLSCARFVRITDTSNPADFSDATADGFDVDGVQAQGETCTTPSPSPSVSPTPSTSPAPSTTPTPSTDPSPTPQASCCSPTTEIPGSGGNGGTTASTPGFPNAGGSSVVPGFPTAGGNPLIPRLPNAGVGPEIDWSIEGGIKFILSTLSQVFSFKF